MIDYARFYYLYVCDEGPALALERITAEPWTHAVNTLEWREVSGYHVPLKLLTHVEVPVEI